MLSRYFAIAALGLAFFCVYAAYSHNYALVLRQDNRGGRGTRFGSTSSGRYRNGTWVSSPTRSTYGSFQGGGPGAGK